MRIVVNSDRIFAALIRKSKCREIILSEKFEFLTVDFARKEIQEHVGEILRKTGLSLNEVETILGILFKSISIVNDAVIKKKYKNARKIMDHIDPNDTPFIALALSVENEGIWTEDKHFMKQKRIRIWKTIELMDLIRD